MNRQPVRRYIVKNYAFLTVILLAFALRLACLGHKSLWIDEADSVYFAQHAWRNLVWQLCDPHAPGYYALLKLFIELGGSNEFVVRLPSAIAGTLGIAALARLARELSTLYHTKTGLSSTFAHQILPALLLTVSPLHTWYSQEARMYTWVALLSLGAAIFAAKSAQQWRWTSAVGYGVMASAAILVDQSATAVLVGLTGGLTLYAISQKKRGLLVRWLGLQCLPILVFYGWYHQASYASKINTNTLYPLTMVHITLERIRQVLNTLPITLSRQSALAAGGMVAVFIISATAWVRLKRVKRSISIGSLKTLLVRILAGSNFVAWLIVVAYLVGAVASVIPRLYTLKRLLVSLLPYALLLVTWAINRLSVKRHYLGTIVIAVFALALWNVNAVPKAPWREAITTLGTQTQPGDSIWVDELAGPVFDYYDRGVHAREILFVNDLGSLAQQRVRGSFWFVVVAGRYRNPLDFLPGLGDKALLWRGAWPEIEIRAYDSALLPPAALNADVPSWALGWPSPLDEACAGQE